MTTRGKAVGKAAEQEEAAREATRAREKARATGQPEGAEEAREAGLVTELLRATAPATAELGRATQGLRAAGAANETGVNSTAKIAEGVGVTSRRPKGLRQNPTKL